jgi:hypothetical protein
VPQFGTNSKKARNSCDQDLQDILNDTVEHFDCTVVWGHRDMEQQNKAFNEGNSKNRWPTSKHNSYPSRAFDLVPYPEGYDASYEKFYEMATYVFAAASARGVRIRWGGHWKNYTGKGPNDRDWAHFEKM